MRSRAETDTEVIAHLVEEAYGGDHDLLQAVREATERLIGAYALAVVSDREPGTIVAARKDSPLVVGLAEDGAYVASDIIAMIDATRDVAVLADGDMAKLTPDDDDVLQRARRGVRARAHACRLGPGRGRKGRLPRLHDEGDPRAAARSSATRWRAAW